VDISDPIDFDFRLSGGKRTRIPEPDELEPIESIPIGERYGRVIGMLMGNPLREIGRSPGARAFVLDGKVYHVSGYSIDVWDYSVFSRAVRTEAIPSYTHSD
jgi:hypothetical protein